MIWVLIAIVVVVLAVLVIVLRRPRQEPGVASFRRHIDALSPEARREVMDRHRSQDDSNDGPNDGPNEGPGN